VFNACKINLNDLKFAHVWTGRITMLTSDAVKHFKGKAKLANALQISPAAVSQWGDFVPLLRQFQLNILSGGSLKIRHTKGLIENAA
jgi:hypothetical protein